jgi:hypothetical protein
MADTQFGVKTPLCNICQNQLKHKFDNAHPDKPIMTCRELGDIPAELLLAKSFTCGKFILDEEKYKTYKDLLPIEFNPSK